MESVKKSIPYSFSGDKEQDEKLLQPFIYILQVPGKQIRAALAHAMNCWLKIPDTKMNAIGELVQILHTSSLLLDDIQDNSVLRRGIPVAHSIYGIASTINAANYGIFIALERVIALNHPEASKIFTEQLLELHRGQGLELYWRDNYLCPTEDDYRDMTLRKTGGLFNLVIRLMQLFSDCKEDFSVLSGILGLYFQIRDDYCNLVMQEYSDSKSFCEDLSEGKFSFPIIHAIQTHPEDCQVINILRKRTTDVEVKKYCVSLLEKFGSFVYTRSVLEDLDKKARKEVERLGGNPLFMKILDKLSFWPKNTESLLDVKSDFLSTD
ncbi:geranylgeranyl pyrophosphate synthase [Chelonus insularis]|uniref:geranylgeranyl pyrophosphate synthase n=1 Tax=Chelonus insularis TaxID=460826 RepID=UPI0015895FD7|nr:geranylgeranyl pyrophosphate synthase [Chelonus insularis]